VLHFVYCDEFTQQMKLRRNWCWRAEANWQRRRQLFGADLRLWPRKYRYVNVTVFIHLLIERHKICSRNSGRRSGTLHLRAISGISR